MSESDTMFNRLDRSCVGVQLTLSTDPSYDNRTIASALKMQIRTVQRLRAQLNASDEPLQGPGNHWWNSPAAYSADYLRFRRLTHNCECMGEEGLEV